VDALTETSELSLRISDLRAEVSKLNASENKKTKKQKKSRKSLHSNAL
jgi:hypothetical protein